MPLAVLLLLLAVAVLRGAAYLPVSWSLEELTLLQVVAAEVLVAGVAMLGILAISGRLRGFVLELRSRPVLALRLMLLQTVVPFALIGLGLQHVPTGTASVLVCAAPLFATVVAGARNAHDRPTSVQGLGLLSASPASPSSSGSKRSGRPSRPWAPSPSWPPRSSTSSPG